VLSHFELIDVWSNNKSVRAIAQHILDKISPKHLNERVNNSISQKVKAFTNLIILIILLLRMNE